MELERQIDMVQLGGGEVERKSAASEALGGLRAGLGALGNKVCVPTSLCPKA